MLNLIKDSQISNLKIHHNIILIKLLVFINKSLYWRWADSVCPTAILLYYCSGSRLNVIDHLHLVLFGSTTLDSILTQE